MIFVTIGSEKFAFDRLLQVIDEAVAAGQIRETVFAQTGHSQYIPKSFKHCTFMPFNEMIEFIKKAHIVVSHAGVGTILLCLNLGKVPIVSPRLSKLDEHLDDHQLEFARHFETGKRILVAHNKKELLDKINNYTKLTNTSSSEISSNRNKLVYYLKTAVEGNMC